ncbi:MAG: TolC family protein [Prevotella sp.]|jgi:outer membrane protein|nr:TolC family protein [Prevotella sp.]
MKKTIIFCGLLCLCLSIQAQTQTRRRTYIEKAKDPRPEQVQSQSAQTEEPVQRVTVQVKEEPKEELPAQPVIIRKEQEVSTSAEVLPQSKEEVVPEQPIIQQKEPTPVQPVVETKKEPAIPVEQPKAEPKREIPKTVTPPVTQKKETPLVQPEPDYAPIQEAVQVKAPLFAQGTGKWTLRQCVDYAVENNIDLRQQLLKVKNAEIDLSTTKNSRLPDLTASVGQDFSFGRSTLGDNTSQSVNSTRTSFGVSSSTPIFTGFRIPNQTKADQLTLFSVTEGLKKAKENLELQVVSLYLDVLFKKEILKAYQEQVEYSYQQVERTKILFESGKIPASQLYDINAQLAKDELNVTMAVNDLDLSLLNLSQALNLPQTENFDIEEPNLGDVIYNNISSVIPPDQVYNLALGIKPHVKEAEYKLQSSEKLLKVAQSGYWPTLSLGLGYSTSYRTVSGQDTPSFGKQIKDYGSEYISLSLSIPIFNRFQTRNQVRSARLNIENETLALDNVKLALYKEIQQAYQSATAAQAKYSSTAKAYDAADESFKYAQERYEIGKSTVFEFNEAKTKLLTSRSEQIQAKYDFLFRSKILDFYQGKPIDIE